MLDFINIPLSRRTLHSYAIRSAIFKALNDALPLLHGRLLDVGCGKMPYRQYILDHSNVTEYTGLDIEGALIYDKAIWPDSTWDGSIMPFPDHAFDCAIATEVLEHCPNPDATLKEIRRVLKPNAVFFFTVPFLWTLHEVPRDEYRYTPFALQRLLNNAGFIEIVIKPTGGWHAALAQMLGLWVKRAPMRRIPRAILSRLFIPIIRFLLKKDALLKPDFSKNSMFTGFSGIARA